MNTRILRMAHRSKIGGRMMHIRGLGQLQPVVFFWKDGDLWLRIEGTVDGDWRGETWCYWSFRLSDPQQRARAKAHFAHLEECRREGKPSSAMRLWDDYNARRAS